MLRVGLTGGIACGKSKVLRRLSSAGLPTLDLDLLGHELMAPGLPGHTEVVEAFGASVLAADGAIDRRRLGALVFAEPEARQRLNRILHPRIRAEEARRASLLGDPAGAVLVTDGALLVETGMHLRFDRLIVVHCRPDQQLARLQARDGLSEEEARGRLAAQMPIAIKVQFAHWLVDTSSSLAETHRAADALGAVIGEFARQRPGPVVVSEARVRAVRELGPREGPRGLTPALVAESLAAAEGIDLQSLAASLRPAAEGPWYAVAGEPSPGGVAAQRLSPAGLVGPLVLHELAHFGFDPERLAARAHSLAWLTDREKSRIASTVLYALLLADILALGRLPSDLESRASAFEPLARRWAGSGPSPALRVVMDAVQAHPADVAAAEAVCARAGVEPGLAGALIGAALGPDVSS